MREKGRELGIEAGKEREESRKGEGKKKNHISNRMFVVVNGMHY